MEGPPSFPATTPARHSHLRYSSPLEMRSTHGTRRPGDAPLRRTITLTQGVPQATKNKPSHSSLGTFSKMCCTNGTNFPCPPGAKGALLLDRFMKSIQGPIASKVK